MASGDNNKIIGKKLCNILVPIIGKDLSIEVDDSVKDCIVSIRNCKHTKVLLSDHLINDMKVELVFHKSEGVKKDGNRTYYDINGKEILENVVATKVKKVSLDGKQYISNIENKNKDNDRLSSENSAYKKYIVDKNGTWHHIKSSEFTDEYDSEKNKYDYDIGNKQIVNEFISSNILSSLFLSSSLDKFNSDFTISYLRENGSLYFDSTDVRKNEREDSSLPPIINFNPDLLKAIVLCYAIGDEDKSVSTKKNIISYEDGKNTIHIKFIDIDSLSVMDERKKTAEEKYISQSMLKNSKKLIYDFIDCMYNDFSDLGYDTLSSERKSEFTGAILEAISILYEFIDDRKGESSSLLSSLKLIEPVIELHDKLGERIIDKNYTVEGINKLVRWHIREFIDSLKFFASPDILSSIESKNYTFMTAIDNSLIKDIDSEEIDLDNNLTFWFDFASSCNLYEEICKIEEKFLETSIKDSQSDLSVSVNKDNGVPLTSI